MIVYKYVVKAWKQITNGLKASSFMKRYEVKSKQTEAGTE